MIYTIAALYRFVPLQDVPALQELCRSEFEKLELYGTLLLAPEGINGTLAGSASSIDQMLSLLETNTGLKREDVKFSYAQTKPFNRLKIRIKREIITFKQPTVDPNALVGTYVTADKWNSLLDDPDIVVIDTRNDYETRIGTFEGSEIPAINTFTEFAAYVRATFDPQKHKKIAMFCTGGIRCEKASAFMRAEGFPEVYHLKGGILKYLEDIPQKDSKWNGECYVFDRRISVSHGLKEGSHAMCFTCGYPLSEDDKKSPKFETGVSCDRCHANTSDEDKARYRMRQHQMEVLD